MCNCDSDRSFHNAVTIDSKWKFNIINILVIQNKKFIQLHKKNNSSYTQIQSKCGHHDKLRMTKLAHYYIDRERTLHLKN